MHAPIRREQSNTVPVFFATVCLSGQTTFFSSLFISRNQRPRSFFFLLFASSAILIYTPFLKSPILLGLGVERVLSAEGAILIEFQLIRSVLLVLHRIVVSLLALVASQSDFNAHLTAPPYYWYQGPVSTGDTDCLPDFKRPCLCAKSEKYAGQQNPFSQVRLIILHVPFPVNTFSENFFHIFHNFQQTEPHFLHEKLPYGMINRMIQTDSVYGLRCFVGIYGIF